MKENKTGLQEYKINIQGLRLFAYHGVLPEENKLGQEFEIDLFLTVVHPSTLKDECLDHVLSYWDAIETVKHVFTSKTFKLLENAAQTILDSLAEYRNIKCATIHLKKLNPPIPVTIDYVSVIIEKNY